jgi:RNA polymerase sigma-70 factor (ECF subfamily)
VNDNSTHSEESDRDLILSYRDGGDDPFPLLQKKYIDVVYAFILRMTNDQHLAEDATQQTFVNVWRKLETFNTEKRFLSWVLAIARNATIDLLRKKRSVPISFFDTTDGNNILLDTTPDLAPLPDEIFARKELGQELLLALATLTFSEREILTLHYESGLTFDDIGEILARPKNTVKSIHRRALQKLRTWFTGGDASHAPKDNLGAY